MLDTIALTLFDVLAVRRDRLDIPVLPALISGRIDDLRSNREDALYRIAGHQGEAFATVNSALSEIIMPDLARHRADLHHLSRVAGALDRLMLEQGRVFASDDLQDLVDDRCVRAPLDSAR